MENRPALPLDEEIPLTLDTRLLREVARRKGRRALFAGGAVCCLLMAEQLLIAPQMFRGEVSIAVQQSTPALGGLGSLLGAGTSTSKKYIGVLKSRNLAETVESQAHLQQFYHLKTHRDAITLLTENVRPEDSATDGLLMLHLNLPGPPALAPDPERRRERAKELVAQCTNAYAVALRDYYDKSNSERDNVLLKAAETERQRANSDYKQSTARIRAFVSNLARVPAISAPSGGGTSEGSGASQGMMTLYQDQDRVASDIRAAEAVQEAQRRLTAGQLQNLKSLPAEDPLLNEARAAVSSAERTLKRRQDVYGPDNPLVLEAKGNVRRANEELARQIKGIEELRTTDQIDLQKRLESLRARRDTITAGIARMESRIVTRRDLTARMELLRNEQQIALKEREAAEVKSSEVRMSAVGGRSMISVVDWAEPPLQGSPGKLRTLLLGLVVGALVGGIMLAAEYLRQARLRALEALQYAVSLSRPPVPEAPHKNGGTSNTVLKPKK